MMTLITRMCAPRFLLLLAPLALGGCASPGNPDDPFERVNRGVYRFNDTLDKAVVKPVAKGYNAVVPAPGRMLINNFFSNLDDVTVTLNDLLQLKVKQGLADSARVVVNTSIGFFGLVDVATAVGLEKHHEDFGQTLGHWGLRSGPYLVLPVLGPSTLRDSIGLYVDSRGGAMRKVSEVETRNQLYSADLLSTRAALLSREKALDDDMIDRYAFIRDAYLQYRNNLVFDGNVPHDELDDYDEEDNEGGDDVSALPDEQKSSGAAAPPAAEKPAASTDTR
ncbi:MAG: VacJ family lipoprotein [Pseudomonadota bacterium]